MTQAGMLLVTGASSGIGAAVARMAGVRGYAVAVNYSANRAGAEGVVRDIAAGDGQAVAIQADVAREEEVLRLFTTAEEALGPLAALVNNAGITGAHGPFRAVDAADLRRMLDINVFGALLCAREAVRRLSTRHGGPGGAIVNVGSRAAALGGAGEWVHYAASKGAVESMTIGLGRELAAEGVRVNAVSPGLIDTPIHATSGVPDRPERLRPMVPMQRVGSAEEVAEAVLWLLSPAASYVTGTILPVSGGR